MKPFLLLMTALGFIATLHAELPEAVLEACLSPSIYDHSLNQTWTVMTRQVWEEQPLEVVEGEATTTIRLAGTPHPNDWLTTEVEVITPTPTEAQPQPIQTFTVRARSAGVVPIMTLDFTLLNQAKLPPYSVQAWGNRIALVAKAEDWYIIANEPTAKLTQAKTEDKAATLVVPQVILQRTTDAQVSLLIGEGPLPPAPKLK